MKIPWNPKAGRLRALARDQRGTSVVELAIIAPFLSLLTMGIIDLTTGFSRRLELTEAVNRTIEKLGASNFEVPGSQASPDFSGLRADAAEAAKVPLSAVTVTRWLECDGVEQAAFECTCAKDETRPECQVVDPDPDLGCTPVIARYVQIRVDTSFEPAFATVVAPRADGTFPLFAEAAVRIQ